MSEAAFPEYAEAAAIVADYEARCRRVETPCGDGTLVWRIWGEGEPLVVGHGAQGAWSHWIRNIDGLTATRGVAVFDFNKDGWMDVAVTHTGAPGLSLWRNVDGGSFERVPLPLKDALADLSGSDGKGAAHQ